MCFAVGHLCPFVSAVPRSWWGAWDRPAAAAGQSCQCLLHAMHEVFICGPPPIILHVASPVQAFLAHDYHTHICALSHAGCAQFLQTGAPAAQFRDDNCAGPQQHRRQQPLLSHMRGAEAGPRAQAWAGSSGRCCRRRPQTARPRDVAGRGEQVLQIRAGQVQHGHTGGLSCHSDSHTVAPCNTPMQVCPSWQVCSA